jgi:hypothetical protein
MDDLAFLSRLSDLLERLCHLLSATSAWGSSTSGLSSIPIHRFAAVFQAVNTQCFGP